MKNISKEIIFLSGQGNHHLGSQILKELTELYGQDCIFDHININKHPDKENDNRIVKWEKIKGKVVVYYGSLYSQELLDEALDLIWACKHQYEAKYIILVAPFLINRRQDSVMQINKDQKWSKKIAKPDEIQRLRQTIFFLRQAGVDEMIVATPHSIAMSKSCDEFGIKFHEIDPSSLFAIKAQTLIPEEDLSLVNIYAPDAGSIPRAVALARILNCPVLFNLKDRASNNTTSIVNEEEKEIKRLEKEFREYYNYEEIYYVSSELLTGSIVIMVDDEITTGGTANDTGIFLIKQGIKALYFFATHAVLTFGWRNRLFYKKPFTVVAMADSIPRGYDKQTGGDIININLYSLFGSKLFKILNQIK